jgi:Lipocalin-like domain
MRPEAASQSLPLSQQLVGTWVLLSRVDRTGSGERRIEPMLGEDPIALLYYDSSGYFAAQFMKRNRAADAVVPPVPAAVVASAAPNNTRAQGG